MIGRVAPFFLDLSRCAARLWDDTLEFCSACQYCDVDEPTIRYYSENAASFFRETVGVQMSPLYDRFLRLIPPDGHILDAGCGSGRDALFFRSRGYRVTAFDGSEKLAHLAAEHTGLDVMVLRLQDVTWVKRFDGVWACASLLHVPAIDLAHTVRRLANALKPTGILYASFKYGQGEHERNGRIFTDLDETGFEALINDAGRPETVETWISADVRPGRGNELWFNALLRAAA